MGSFCMNEGGAYRVTLGTRLPHMEFVLDSADDLVNLPTNTESSVVGGEEVGPCAPGSVALIPNAAGSEIYMMNPSGEWYVI